MSRLSHFLQTDQDEDEDDLHTDRNLKHLGQFRPRNRNHSSPILDSLASVFRKSTMNCVQAHDACDLDIGLPTDVKHVSHVTFDQYSGFLGLPLEFEHDVPRSVFSASSSVFGVSAKSMHCSYDNRGNCVPTILLMMQRRLYTSGGLHAEGIFRISAEKRQEGRIRKQLNMGVLPHRVGVHYLAGLIKAWFRELPTGILDCFTSDQVMHCNTEEECAQLVSLLPPFEAGLLDWAINLMADVVQHEHHNKMNPQNIAMVFAPNMTQMANPLTALICAVQVMNFLKTLIINTLRERESVNPKIRPLCRCLEFQDNYIDFHLANTSRDADYRKCCMQTSSVDVQDEPVLRSAPDNKSESDGEDIFWSLEQCESDRELDSISGDSMSSECEKLDMGNGFGNEYHEEYKGYFSSLHLWEGVAELCSRHMLWLSHPGKNPENFVL